MTLGRKMFTTAPPNGDDATTMSVLPLTEMSVAELFISHYQFCIMRIDDEEDGDSLFIAPCLYEQDGEKLIPPIYGGVLPDAYVFLKLMEFIGKLTANADELTQIRCGQYAFINGVMEILRRDQRLVVTKMRPSDDEYSFNRVDHVVETRHEHRRRALAPA
jgi:hypothetical protein